MTPEPTDSLVHAVIVSYRSADTLRGCIEPLTRIPRVRVTVVDNNSPDDALETIANLEVEMIRSQRNGGFSYGCNLGAAGATAPYLLFVNPDARIEPQALDALLDDLQANPAAALAGPMILEPGDELAFSRRRFPRQSTTFAQALFLHRLWPQAAWTDELIRDEAEYARAGTADWVSGACMLVRRTIFEAIGGFDERFFLYCEDTDLCRRIWDAGHGVRFVPGAIVRHVGGHSSGAGETQPILARSRVLYARKHDGAGAAKLQAAGVALGEATHALVALKRPRSRRGHMAALRTVLGR